MPGLRDLIVALSSGMRTGGFEEGLTVRFPVKEPEGDVNALNFLQLILGGERSGQEKSLLIMLFQRRDGSLLIQLKGNDVIRLQCTGKLTRNHGGIAAVGAGRGGRGGIADQLRRAGRAGIGFHAVCVGAPVLAETGQIPFALLLRLICFRFLMGFHSLFFLLLIQRLDLRQFKDGPAELAAQLPRIGIELQRTGTGRALMVGDL